MCVDYDKIQKDECARDVVGLPHHQPYLSQLIQDIGKERWRYLDDFGRTLEQPMQFAPPRPAPSRGRGRGRPFGRPMPYNRYNVLPLWKISRNLALAHKHHKI